MLRHEMNFRSQGEVFYFLFLFWLMLVPFLSLRFAFLYALGIFYARTANLLYFVGGRREELMQLMCTTWGDNHLFGFYSISFEKSGYFPN